MSQEVFIGARGWLHPVWDEKFYPEDMPEEWRLDYYSNEYKVVLVPAAQWREAGADATEWRDEVFEDFRFYFEIDAAWPQGSERLAEHIAALGGNCGGVVIAPGVAAGIADWVALEGLNVPRFAMLKPDEPAPAHGVIRGAYLDAINPADYPSAGEAKECVHGISGVNGETTPRELRTLLETALRLSNDAKRVVIFFTGDPPPMDEMDETITLAEMLGV